MTIRINKIIGKPSKKSYVDPQMVRDVELAREVAWNYAYLRGGVIG